MAENVNSFESLVRGRDQGRMREVIAGLLDESDPGTGWPPGSMPGRDYINESLMAESWEIFVMISYEHALPIAARIGMDRELQYYLDL